MSNFRHHAGRRAAATLAATLALGAAAQAETLVGLTTNNTIVTFDSGAAGTVSTPAAITGLQAVGERILAIDLRPTTGVLYGISDASKVYSLTLSGAATFISGLSTALTSSAVGLDFNPVADLSGATSLRIVSGSGQNFAYNVATGATTVATAVQPGFSAVAYANNDIDAGTGTALYFIDAASDQLKVATANFNAPTITTVGALGVDAGDVTGFDISSSGSAFAVLSSAGAAQSSLYAINLTTGAASFSRALGVGGVVGLTAITAPVPEPQTYALMLAGLLAVAWVTRQRQSRTTNG